MIPGAVLLIQQHGRPVYFENFGVRDLATQLPMTADTIFRLYSMSKAVTSVAAMMLVDDGKLRWDDKVTRWLPGFQLYDPYITRELTMRDVLSHRSGLGRRGDALWYGTSYSRREILRRIRFLPPNAGFRTEMGYQNVMVMAAGEASGEAAGIQANLGFSLIGAGQQKPGLDNLEAAFAKDPSQARVGFALTVMYIKLGEFEAAVSMAGKVAERDQGAPGRNLPGVARQAGDPEQVPPPSPTHNSEPPRPHQIS